MVNTTVFPGTGPTIHERAVAILLGPKSPECELRGDEFAYLVVGGTGGHLYYKKGEAGHWVLIANWCFYGTYLAVRFRKAKWLRPMYHRLFARMHYQVLSFGPYGIEVVGTSGEKLNSRIFRLSPPGAFEQVMGEKFGFSEEHIASLARELDL